MSEDIRIYRGFLISGLDYKQDSVRSLSLDTMPLTTPEDLIIETSAVSYLMTLDNILKQMKVNYVDISIVSKGVYNYSDCRKKRLHTIEHSLEVFVVSEDHDTSDRTINKYVSLAKENCIFSETMLGNVNIIVRVEVVSFLNTVY